MKVNIGTVDFGDRKSPVYVVGSNLQRTAKGKAHPASDFLGAHDKGTARKLRKALRKAGFTQLAAAPRKTLKIC